MDARAALADRTNQDHHAARKRRADEELQNEGAEKKAKLVDENHSEGNVGGHDRESCNDCEMEDASGPSCVRYQDRRDTFSRLRALRSGVPTAKRMINLSTMRILESFVSSHRVDLYKCQSLAAGVYQTVPYACSFSHKSKKGKECSLAVATEHGTVDIIDTKFREEWDPEPPRNTFHVHDNGIFDIRWSPDDRFLATASGDSTVRILDPRHWTGVPLHKFSAHMSTVKCLAWDPKHTSLLATAGRDGCICLWDIRESQSARNSMEVDDDVVNPITHIKYAHEPVAGKPSKKGRTILAARSVTSLLYSPVCESEIISSGSSDGILRKWDLRALPSSPSKRSKKPQAIVPIDESVDDLTKSAYDLASLGNISSPRRSRGISSLAIGSGPTVGKIFALANDARVHTYNPLGAIHLPLEIPQANEPSYSHRNLKSSSFYVRVGVSPCGRWLASGSGNDSAFLFDIANSERSGVELRGQSGEVAALDWADGQLATCADDGTVRIWRPDLERHRECINDPEEATSSWSWAKA